jgi:hypothetical protein
LVTGEGDIEKGSFTIMSSSGRHIDKIAISHSNSLDAACRGPC